MPTILGANTLSTGYDVANSCRFDGSSDYMHKTPGGAGNRRTLTISAWVKRSDPGNHRCIMAAGSGGARDMLLFESSDKLQFSRYDGSYVYQLNTNALYRDPSAWLHIVGQIDTTQSTESDRVKLYVNGVQITDLAVANYPSQNFDTDWNSTQQIRVGVDTDDNAEYYGYMTEVVMVDGSALTPTSFGEFDSDSPNIWKPKDVSGLTFGTNGFYLDFEDSSNLGNDASGGTDFTEVNLTSIDQTTDTCTNNYTTMNPIANYFGAQTYSEGNLKSVSPQGNAAAPSNTFGVSNGRWYAEAKLTNQTSNQTLIGISSNLATQDDFNLGRGATSYGMYSNGGGYYVNNGSAVSYGTSYTTNDIIGIYIDLTSNKLYMSKNGTLLNSGTGISITDPDSTQLKAYFFSGHQWDNNGTCTWEWNFGAGTTYAISSGNTDDNGYGNFEYSPNITGDGSAKSFYALNTKNLAEFG